MSRALILIVELICFTVSQVSSEFKAYLVTTDIYGFLLMISMFRFDASNSQISFEHPSDADGFSGGSSGVKEGQVCALKRVGQDALA